MIDEKAGIQLTTLQVSGYRSLKNASFLPTSNLSVLIGPNGSGKTNVLQGLLLLRPLLGRQYFRRPATEEPLARVVVEAGYRIDNKKVSYRLEFVASAGNASLDTPRVDHWTIEWDDGRCKTYEFPAGFLNFLHGTSDIAFTNAHRYWPSDGMSAFLELQESGNGETLQRVAQFNQNLRYYSASMFTDPARCPSSFEVEGADYALVDEFSTRGPHRAFVHELYRLWKTDPDAYANVMRIVGKEGIGLVAEVRWKSYELSASEVKVREGGKVVRRRRRRTLVIPMVRMRHANVSFNQLSDGTFKTFALIFYLLQNDWSMLLLEEPEVCVHYGLLASMVELIKSRARRRQVVVSTHSELLLDLVKPEQVFVVSIGRSGTEVARLDQALSQKEMQALREYLQRTGNLGEYWGHGGFQA